MNYNRLNDQIVFIDKRDTVVFGNPETASEIMIGTDKFYFHNKGYVEKVTEYLTINLGINQKVKFVGSAKKDGFGSYSAISNSVNLNTQDAVGNKEKADENHTYKSITTYYLIDKNNTIVLATEKNISSASPQYKKEIKTFISSNKTNFKKRADIEKLLEFTNSLK
ncbi:MAG TPA: hypothetical protein VNI52_09515 [Sphingobacteriaceae bacterium]|nr:hypothetical protein [Sphingobacteriaceae bacterium]